MGYGNLRDTKSPRQFRHRMGNRGTPPESMARVTAALEELVVARDKGAWTFDSRATTSVTVSREARSSRWFNRIRWLWWTAYEPHPADVHVDHMALGSKASADIVKVAYTPPPRYVRLTEFLTVQAHETSKGSDLELRGEGGDARRLAKDLLKALARGGEEATLRR